MSSSENRAPMVPPGIVHPSTLRTQEELAWAARRYGQFRSAQDPSHPFPGTEYLPNMPPKQHLGRQSQQNAWVGTYDFRPPGNAYPPLQSMQPSVSQQWQGFIGETGFYDEVPNPGPPEYRGPPQVLYDSRGQPGSRGRFQARDSSLRRTGRGRGFAPALPRAVAPDREKTPTQRVQNAKSDNVWRGFVWEDRAHAPQPSYKYSPPPLPQLDLDFVAKVGDIVRIKPWAGQFTWIHGRVERADFSVIKHHKPLPRYIVSYIEPASKQLRQRKFCSHLSEIMIKEPDEPELQPLPRGTERNIYACIPPPVQPNEGPIGMSWAQARILKIDDNGHFSIRVLAGLSKDLIFDDFDAKYTVAFTTTSLARIIQMGLIAVSSDEPRDSNPCQ
ncbi:hypothetical protein C8R46DRAFT_144172 [Mycena filopes]|nr:hypothetical protein C8R46DRAFT_144172 [Mycena filopes]